MPLIALAVAAYAAGLLAGFGGVAHPALAIVAIAALVGLVRRNASVVALAALGLAGVAIGSSETIAERRCARLAAEAGEVVVLIRDAAAPGSYVRGTGRPVGSRCTLRLGIHVAHGHAAAGARAVARGRVSVSRQGAVVRDARVRAWGSGGVAGTLVRLRGRLGASIDRDFGDGAPLARALLIADARALDPALRDRFAAAGLVHVLSISGLHVAIIALAIELACRAMRLGPRAATIVTVLTTAAYIATIGAPPPAVRAGVMLGVAALSRLIQRSTSPWAALAVGAIGPLWSPRTVTDLGYQLSVVGMLGLIASGALTRRWIAPRLGGWRADVARLALASTVTTLATVPLVAWHFGRISFIAPMANLLAAPVVAVMQPALFLALVLSPVAALSAFVADACSPLLRALDVIATTAAGVPGAAVSVAPTLAAAVVTSVAVAAFIAACVSRDSGRALVVTAAAVASLCWLPSVPSAPGTLEIHAIDVGQGDAIALRTPVGRWVLIDAGRTWRGGDAGRTTVVPYLRRYGGELVAVVLTHPHADHAGGVPTVLRALRPGTLLDGAFVGRSESYLAVLRAALGRGVRWERVRPGGRLTVDGVEMEFLAPDSAWMSGLADANEASVVARVRYGTVRILLVGDAERGEEEWLLAHARDRLSADVLKVGHHGSGTSTTPGFLEAVRPRFAIVSVGAGNAYGHPSPAVIEALAAAGATVLRTDQTGSVVVRTDGRRIEAEAERDRW